jgi:hypothetical protein
MNRSVTIAAPLFLLAITSCTPQGETESFPALTGDYLGQTPPGNTPQLFAPGIVSTGMYERDVAMTPDGREIYYCVVVGDLAVIMQTKLENGGWTEPEIAPFSADPQFMNMEPHISPDGQRFYFLSNRPGDGSDLDPDLVGRWVNQDIWVMDRIENGWGEPYNPGAPLNSGAEEYFPSVTREGTIYFTRQGEDRKSYIYRVRMIDGSYSEAEQLGPEVNSTEAQYNAFIAPDESYIIVCVFGREDSHGGTDYYVVFRDDNDDWTGPINMGETINQPSGSEWSPYVTPDGNYLFFMSTRADRAARPDALTRSFLEDTHSGPQNGNPDIYWVDASIIEELRPEG